MRLLPVLLAACTGTTPVDQDPCSPGVDADGDGLCAPDDNCDLQANADQADTDGDGVGDVCDTCVGGLERFGAEQMIYEDPFEWVVDLELSDLDGDGDLDLMASMADWYLAWGTPGGVDAIGVWWNTPAGWETPILLPVNYTYSVSAADLDGDGDQDLITTGSTDAANLAWLPNLGGGSFGAALAIDTLGVSAQDARAADLDGDGDMDVVSANSGDGTVTWHENVGPGLFVPYQTLVTGQSGSSSLALEDLDADGDIDVVSSARWAETVSWVENLGGGSFAAAVVLPTPASGTLGVAAGDLDGDGDGDVAAIAGSDTSIQWYENAGGTFSSAVALGTGGWADDVGVADVDGDGDEDVLALGGLDEGGLVWFENTGGGSFAAGQPLPVDLLWGEALATGDFDGDGDLDVFSGGYGGWSSFTNLSECMP